MLVPTWPVGVAPVTPPSLTAGRGLWGTGVRVRSALKAAYLMRSCVRSAGLSGASVYTPSLRCRARIAANLARWMSGEMPSGASLVVTLLALLSAVDGVAVWSGKSLASVGEVLVMASPPGFCAGVG